MKYKVMAEKEECVNLRHSRRRKRWKRAHDMRSWQEVRNDEEQTNKKTE